MKKTGKRLLGLVCAVCVTVSAFGMNASALTIQDRPDTIPVIDVEWQCPVEIVNVEMQEKQFIVSTRTDKGKINNLYFSFPVDGGVRLHGDNTGFFQPEETSVIDYSSEGAAIVMQGKDTKVKLYQTSSPWRFEVYNAKGEMVIWYLADHMYFGYDEKGALRKVKLASAVDEYETLFGLGERFGGFVQNGKTVEMWNFDSFGQLKSSYGDHNVGYKNIPILHSNNGYTVFHNNNYYGVVDVADSSPDECSFEFYGPILDLYVWTGTTLANIERYHTLTGSTVTVPKYALSYWAGQSTSMWISEGRDSESVNRILKTNLDRYDEMNTPIKVIFMEAAGNSTEYSAVHDFLQSRGVKWLGWLKSTYNSWDKNTDASSITEKLGFSKSETPLVKWDYAKLANYWNWNGEAYLDFTNPASKTWLFECLSKYMPMGLIGMMVDYNDEVTVDAYYPYLGKNGEEMHNLSQYFYAKRVYEAFEDYYGEGNFVNIVRAGTAGSQSYGAVFGGDQASSFLGLQESVSALLSGASSGIHVWGSDIGGLGHPDDKRKNDPELYARWLQLGTFSPLMRTHGQTSWRDPWRYSDASVALFQKYYWVRESMVDLVNSGILKANVENHPLVQSMVVAYPEQKKLAANSTQYLFCDSLLICPVTESGATALTVQFPKGRWVNIWDGTVIAGDCEQKVSATLDTIPVYLEAGSAIPMTLGENLRLGGVNTLGKNTNALVVAPAVEKKENVIYLDKATTETYICDTLGDDQYSVTAGATSEKKLVVAMGCAANAVKVDNTELAELSERPDSGSVNPGFYRDMENNATIIVTEGNWTTITYMDSRERLENLALGKTVLTEGLSEKSKSHAPNITDGDYSTGMTLMESKTANVVIDLLDKVQLNKILVKWGSDYARGYRMEVSDSMEEGAEWVTVFEKKKGGGGTDTIVVEKASEYRYIRISDVDTTSKTGAKLVEVEAYGDVLYNEADVPKNEGDPDKEQDPGKEKEPAGDLEQNHKTDHLIWYVTGGIAAAILIGCAVTAVVITKKKKGGNDDEEDK